ncbi:MAG TPA: hypothetical protein VJC20_00285 [Candidatus Paceibacterota bacterium]
MTKYKYYFKKPKQEIAADALKWLAVGGVVVAAVMAPNAVGTLVRTFPRRNQYPRKHTYNAFYRLYKTGCLEIEKKNHQIYILLNEKGRRRAGRLQMNHLKIKKPKRWDGKWRIIIFDIAHTNRLKREALRGFLKRLEFYLLQKSVWVYPYDCSDEIETLKDFFGLGDKEIRLIVATDIGADSFLRDMFKV